MRVDRSDPCLALRVRCKHTRIHTSTPPRRLPRAERRAQILRAAAATFVRAGFDGTSMDDVARSAGVTRLIVYRIFTSKEELYRAVLEQVTTRLGEEFDTLVGDRTTHGADDEA